MRPCLLLCNDPEIKFNQPLFSPLLAHTVEMFCFVFSFLLPLKPRGQQPPTPDRRSVSAALASVKSQ